ncbi:hypothetical protein WR25_07512 [Diploscapter pachys]|uniref:MalT-like TPR region domain-containing protein n=1 Tax=Diploscapter pachys TaxID=2018661 RepID=A0A2A2JKC1_9BILA|nr:hypothetical protein WR25_07512 [Diploscapter pachys]
MGSYDETQKSCLEWGQEAERHCRKGRTREGILCFEKALEVGTDDLQVLSAIYCQMGCTYFNINDLDAALRFHTLDMELEKTLGDKKSLSRACGNIGNVHKKKGNFDLAIQFIQQQLSIAKEAQDKECIARAHFNMGSAYWLKGRYMKKVLAVHSLSLPGISSALDEPSKNLRVAAQHFEEAVEILDELPDQTTELDRLYGSLGNVYYLLTDYETSIKYHNKRLDLARQRNDKAAQLRAYLNLGNANVFLNDIDRAFEYYRIGIALAIEISDRASEGQACYHLANTALLIEDYQTAHEYFIRHLRIVRELKDAAGEAKTCQFLSIIFNRQDDPAKAIYFLGLARKIGNEQNLPALVVNAEKVLRVIVKENENLITDNQELKMDSSADPNPRSIRLSMSMTSLGSPGFPTSLRMAFSEVDLAPIQETPKAAPRGDVGTRATFHQDDFFETIMNAQSRRLDDQRCDASVILADSKRANSQVV